MAGIFGNLVSFCFSPKVGVGASGAILGLLGALLYYGLENPFMKIGILTNTGRNVEAEKVCFDIIDKNLLTSDSNKLKVLRLKTIIFNGSIVIS